MRANERLTLGLLPDKKLDWRKFVLSYGLVLFAFLFLLLSNLLWPDHMPIWTKFSVMEVTPRTNMMSDIPKPKSQRGTKLLPAAKRPIPIAKPKRVVPKEIVRPKVQEAKLEPPKIQSTNFQAPKI